MQNVKKKNNRLTFHFSQIMQLRQSLPLNIFFLKEEEYHYSWLYMCLLHYNPKWNTVLYLLLITINYQNMMTDKIPDYIKLIKIILAKPQLVNAVKLSVQITHIYKTTA